MDLISRHDAIEVVRKWFDKMKLNGDICIDGIISLPSAQTDLIAKIQNGINATNANDSYSCGMRNGMRWCISLIDDKEPLYENCPSAQPEPAIPLQWIEAQIEWLKSLDNAFSTLTALQISAMVNKWKGEQDG